MRTDQKLFLLKCLLTVFLVLLWILASAVLGVLLWLRFGFWTKEYLEVDGSLLHYNILIYMGQGDAGLVVLFSLFGLIGGLRRIKCCLVVYLIALLLAFGLTVAGCVYGFIYREQLQDTMGKDSLILDFAQHKYTGESTDKVTRAVDSMQSELGCCGGNSPRDFIMSSWHQADTESRDGMVPGSCCKDYSRYQGSAKGMCPVWLMDENGLQLQEYNDNLHQEGCKQALIRFFDSYVLIVAGVVIALGVLQLICLIVLIILIHILNNLYVPQPDDIVYDMARNQEKSPYPSRGDYKEYYT